MDYDDWIFESIKKYKNLSIYDMQQCVTAMDWVSRKSLCVGTSTGNKNEILELALPDKMLQSEEDGKLKKDRDFRVLTGGFCKSPINDIKHIPDTRYCMTATTGETTVSVWKMGDCDTDLMTEEKSISAVNSTCHPTQISVHTNNLNDNSIVFGSSLNNITVLDTERFEKIRDFSGDDQSDQVSSIFHRTASVLMCCTSTGDIYTCDLRCEKVKVNCSHKVVNKKQVDWTATKLNDQSDSIILASTHGDVVVLDSDFREKCVRKTCDSPKGKGNHFFVQGSPDGSRFSISGLDGMVYIYNSPLKDKNEILEPVFVHEGHKRNSEDQSDSVCVVKHMWYPWQQDLIISSATDSSLHAWQYNPI